MSEADTVTEWLHNIGLVLGGSAITALLSGLVKKPWTKTERDESAAKVEAGRASGQAEVLAAMASTFTDVTTGLREEIERLQTHASEMRQNAVQFETELKAALERVNTLERVIGDKNKLIDRLQTERDGALERVTQQEGEIRQLNAIIDGYKRADNGASF